MLSAYFKSNLIILSGTTNTRLTSWLCPCRIQIPSRGQQLRCLLDLNCPAGNTTILKFLFQIEAYHFCRLENFSITLGGEVQFGEHCPNKKPKTSFRDHHVSESNSNNHSSVPVILQPLSSGEDLLFKVVDPTNLSKEYLDS